MSTMLISVGDSCGLNSFPFAVFKAQNWQKKKHGVWSQWQVSIKNLGIFFLLGRIVAGVGLHGQLPPGGILS